VTDDRHRRRQHQDLQPYGHSGDGRRRLSSRSDVLRKSLLPSFFPPALCLRYARLSIRRCRPTPPSSAGAAAERRGKAHRRRASYATISSRACCALYIMPAVYPLSLSSQRLQRHALPLLYRRPLRKVCAAAAARVVLQEQLNKWMGDFNGCKCIISPELVAAVSRCLKQVGVLLQAWYSMNVTRRKTCCHRSRRKVCYLTCSPVVLCSFPLLPLTCVNL
jgi:hypothetical protein